MTKIWDLALNFLKTYMAAGNKKLISNSITMLGVFKVFRFNEKTFRKLLTHFITICGKYWDFFRLYKKHFVGSTHYFFVRERTHEL